MASDLARLLVNPAVLVCIPEADNIGRISLFLGNTLYAVAFGYYTIICFLGYNGMISLSKLVDPLISLIPTRPALPFLHHTELLLSPTFVYAILWIISLFGFNIPKHILPLLTIGAR